MSMPGSMMSAPYSAAPVVLPATSGLARDLPTTEKLVCHDPSPPVSHRLGRGFHRVDDLHVAGAPAEVAGESTLDLVARGRWVLVEQGLGRKNHPWGAEAALHGPLVDKGLLDGVQSAAFGQPLDGHDLLPFAVTARVRHENDGFPSMRTVHAPQSPAPQAYLVPVSPILSLRTSTNSMWGSI